MNDIDEAVKRYEAGHAWDDAAEVIEAEFKQPLDKVVPVRLAADHWEALRREAQELGVGPTTLARMWLLERLRNLRTSRGPAVSTVVRDRGQDTAPHRPSRVAAKVGRAPASAVRGSNRVQGEASAARRGRSRKRAATSAGKSK